MQRAITLVILGSLGFLRWSDGYFGNNRRNQCKFEFSDGDPHHSGAGLAITTATPSALAKITRGTWLYLARSGLATGVSWVCYFRALQVGEATRVAPVDKLSAVFVLAFAALFCMSRSLGSSGPALCSS